MDRIIELMETVDEHIPVPERDVDKPFLMSIEDVVSITGRGTVATGRVERGKLELQKPVEMLGIKESREVVVTGIETFQKTLGEAMAGDDVAVRF